MSIKSLLQIILFLLIIVILGTIYFLYFYSGPLKIISENKNEIEKIEELNISQENTTDQAILDETSPTINSDNIRPLDANQEQTEILTKDLNNSIDTNQKSNGDKIENLTKEIEYIITKKNGDIYKITSKYGKTNNKNSDILDLKAVNGVISSIKRSKIFITSIFAEYNYNSQDSKFYKNVEIKYDGKTIDCDNLDLFISENIAVAYGNVIVKDFNSIMKAQMITLDIITKDIEINSTDKVKIVTN